MAANTAELLFHTTLTVIDYNADTSGSTRTVYVLATHTTLEAAKGSASTALQGLQYAPEDFALYDIHEPGRDWSHGDGVVVFAKLHAGQEFIVSLDTKPNDAGLLSGPKGAVVLPKGAERLYYVLQTKVDYNQGRSGAAQTAEIEGCYVRLEDAVAAARACLAEDRDEYAQYDERDGLALDDEEVSRCCSRITISHGRVPQLSPLPRSSRTPHLSQTMTLSLVRSESTSYANAGCTRAETDYRSGPLARTSLFTPSHRRARTTPWL